MTVDPRTTSLDLPVEWTHLSQAALDEKTSAMGAAYVATYRGPHGGAPHSEVDATDTGPLIQGGANHVVPAALIAAQERLAHGRAPAETWSRSTATTTRAVSAPRCRSSPSRPACCSTPSRCSCTASAWPTWR